MAKTRQSQSQKKEYALESREIQWAGRPIAECADRRRPQASRLGPGVGGQSPPVTDGKENEMAVDRRRGGRFAGGIGVGGVLVVVGVLVALFWSLILGIIIVLVGLIAFGGFVAGKWY
jgi:hypothetical protein